MHLVRWLTLIVAMTVGNAYAQGILLVKEYAWDPESKASPIEYASAEPFSAVYNIITPKGQPRRVIAGLVVQDVAYADIACPTTLLTHKDAKLLAAKVSILTTVVKKWPGSSRFLREHLDLDQAALSAFNKGHVLIYGKWMTHMAYQQQVDAAQKEAAEHQRQKMIADYAAVRQYEKERREAEERRLVEARREEESSKAEAARVAKQAVEEKSLLAEQSAAGMPLAKPSYVVSPSRQQVYFSAAAREEARSFLRQKGSPNPSEAEVDFALKLNERLEYYGGR